MSASQQLNFRLAVLSYISQMALVLHILEK
jgi:hypothetical protein